MQAYVWCEKGYVINGTSSAMTNVTCQSDGSFDDRPVCVGELSPSSSMASLILADNSIVYPQSWVSQPRV